MDQLQEFHRHKTTSNRRAKFTVGAVIFVLLAALGAYGYRLEVSSQLHPAVPDNHLPSP
jgi:hypothetical protein